MQPYESTDVHTGKLWLLGLALVAIVLLAVAGARLLTHMLGAPNYPAIDVEAPAVRMTPDRVELLRAYRASKQAALESYGWVDRDAGIARIPIERAIDLVARRAAAGPDTADSPPAGDAP